MPTLSLAEVDLYYERQGAGPPLLLIGGILRNLADWAPVRDALARDFDLILFDNRCSGRSLAKPCVAGLDVMVGDCVRLLDHLNIDRAEILGHSVGGMVGLNLAARHPDRLERLTVAASGPVASAGQIALFDDLAALYSASCVPRAEWLRLYYQWLFSAEFFDAEHQLSAAIEAARNDPHQQPGMAVHAQVAALRDFRKEPDMAAIACPVLVIAGENDLLVPPERREIDFSPIADLRTVLIPKAAHAVHWENPKAFVKAVTDFHAGAIPAISDQLGRMSEAAGLAR